MIERKSWKPTITSQFLHCPVPFKYDSYSGCVANCQYCFARDFVTFSRRNSVHKEFTHLVGNRPDLFEKWIERVEAKEGYDYSKAPEVAWKERIPLKIGTTADPFPPIEREERITYDMLKILHKYDYPTEIQTKFPNILAEYAEDFIGANWTIAVTLMSTDEEFLKVCEPGAPSAKVRLEAVKMLTDMGFNVMFKVQPAIYPKIVEDMPALIKAFKDAGAWAMNMEGLKVRISMPQNEQAIMQKIGDYMDMNIRDFYKNEKKLSGVKGGSDYELSPMKKEEYTKVASELAKKYGLKFYNADNHFIDVGDGCECCGTAVLRDYKLLSTDARSEFYGNEKGSEHLPKSLVNFVRTSRFKGCTIGDACKLKKD